MADTILVTGATGTVGSEVVKQLSEAGQNIHATVHTPSKAEQLKPYGVEVVEFDYDKPASYEAVLSGVEKVFFVGFCNGQQHVGHMGGRGSRRATAQRFGGGGQGACRAITLPKLKCSTSSGQLHFLWDLPLPPSLRLQGISQRRRKPQALGTS